MGLRVSIIAYDGIEPIDIGATYGVLSMARRIAPEISMHVAAPAREVVMAQGLRLTADCTLEEAGPADVVLVLGGPGYLDPMSIIGLFAAVFGITMVYEVGLLERARERFVETGDPEDALREGLDHTAGAATGAALAMVAAAIPFAVSDLSTVRQFGIGLAVVVVLDAVIVRPVLLPASAELLGRWGWWPTGRKAAAEPKAAKPGVSAPA